MAPAAFRADAGEQVWLVELRSEFPAVKEAWGDLQGAVSAEGRVKIISGFGSDGWSFGLYTGEISVEFMKRPSDAKLARFAAEHRLRLIQRNEFVPEEALFAPLDPSRQYLGEIMDRLFQELRGGLHKPRLKSASLKQLRRSRRPELGDGPR